MDDIQFGKDFLWGGGFAANQMEGAAFEDGKGLCVADINEYQKDIPLEKRNNAEITTAVIQNAVQAEGRTGADVVSDVDQLGADFSAGRRR